MKLVSTATLIAALSFSAITFAQSGDMGGMKMEGKGMQNCMDMKGMKGMDMKDMDAKKCQDMMKGMDAKGTAKSAAHEADAVVKEFDAVQGKVTLAHGPVKSLGVARDDHGVWRQGQGPVRQTRRGRESPRRVQERG